MDNYKCFSCDHECKINTGSMFGAPTKCVVDSKEVEWCRVTDITPFNRPPNQVVTTSQEPCAHCNSYKKLSPYPFCPECGLAIDR